MTKQGEIVSDGKALPKGLFVASRKAPLSAETFFVRRKLAAYQMKVVKPNTPFTFILKPGGRIVVEPNKSVIAQPDKGPH
jgi:hypothetical protein